MTPKYSQSRRNQKKATLYPSTFECTKAHPGFHGVDSTFSECPDGYFISHSDPVPAGFKRIVMRVGCGKCDTCYNERLRYKQLKWTARISAMVEHYESNGGMTQWHVITMSPEDYVPLPEFKQKIRKLHQALNKFLKDGGYDFRAKHVCTFEGHFSERNRYGNPGDSVRLHANLIFYLDTSDPAHYTLVKDYCEQYWKDHNTRTVPDGYKVSRVFSSGVGCYISKYISKESQTTRIMSSQFGWAKFMEEWRLKWLGIEEGEEVRHWALWDVSRLKELRSLVASSKRSNQPVECSDQDMLRLMAAPTKLAVVERSTPSDRYYDLNGGFRICWANEGFTEMSIMSSGILVTPASFDWSMTRSRSVLAKHWQELVFQFQYRRSLSTQRPPPS